MTLESTNLFYFLRMLKGFFAKALAPGAKKIPAPGNRDQKCAMKKY